MLGPGVIPHGRQQGNAVIPELSRDFPHRAKCYIGQDNLPTAFFYQFPNVHSLSFSLEVGSPAHMVPNMFSTFVGNQNQMEVFLIGLIPSAQMTPALTYASVKNLETFPQIFSFYLGTPVLLGSQHFLKGTAELEYFWASVFCS